MIWQRLDNPGHEWARISIHGSASVLRGTAIFLENGIPGRLDYKIVCSPRWETRRAEILGWVGKDKVKLTIERDPSLSWQLNRKAVPGVKGCVDIDFSFSPSTNLLPIRRLDLEIGQEAAVRAAWLIFPGLHLQPLVHWFRRKGPNRYAYRSDTGFSTELEVDAEGFVVDYPPFWAEAGVDTESGSR